jgi:hypothetical protein
MAVDMVCSWMFWTDWGKEAKIERAGLDGSHRQTIVSYDIKWPNGLTLDLVRRRVYWVDAKLNMISSCEYDGAARRQVQIFYKSISSYLLKFNSVHMKGFKNLKVLKFRCTRFLTFKRVKILKIEVFYNGH